MLGEQIRGSTLKFGDHTGKPTKPRGRRMRNVSLGNGMVQHDQKTIEKAQSLRNVCQVRSLGWPLVLRQAVWAICWKQVQTEVAFIVW